MKNKIVYPAAYLNFIIIHSSHEITNPAKINTDISHSLEKQLQPIKTSTTLITVVFKDVHKRLNISAIF